VTLATGDTVFPSPEPRRFDIDEERNVGEGDLPDAAKVIRYRRRVDPGAVLVLLGGAGR
jgi:hypothetical protein